jgi:hypothetical protein
MCDPKTFEIHGSGKLDEESTKKTKTARARAMTTRRNIGVESGFLKKIDFQTQKR